MAATLKFDLRSSEPLPKADLLCGRAAVSAASTTIDTKTLKEKNDGKESPWDTEVQLLDILA